MAKNTLPVNFQDDIMNSSMSGKRRYRVINNSDGTISLEDATTYDQVGSNFGAGQLNATNQAVNESLDKNKVVRDLETIGAITEEGYVPDALALKDVTNSLESQPTFVYDENGKITGYTTKTGGADTVFPFKGNELVVKRFSIASAVHQADGTTEEAYLQFENNSWTHLTFDKIYCNAASYYVYETDANGNQRTIYSSQILVNTTIQNVVWDLTPGTTITFKFYNTYPRYYGTEGYVENLRFY